MLFDYVTCVFLFVCLSYSRTFIKNSKDSTHSQTKRNNETTQEAAVSADIPRRLFFGRVNGAPFPKKWVQVNLTLHILQDSVG